jgi:hypothetical protein
MEEVSLLEILIWEGVSLLEILTWVHYKGMWIKKLRICPIRIEIIYGRGKFVGDFNMGITICAIYTTRFRSGYNFYADNITHIKISNKLTPSINYFLNYH